MAPKRQAHDHGRNLFDSSVCIVIPSRLRVYQPAAAKAFTSPRHASFILLLVNNGRFVTKILFGRVCSGLTGG
jgi:hypothetical protein